MALAFLFLPTSILPTRILRGRPSTILRMVPLRKRGGLRRGRFGFCISSPRRATCGRRPRGWGCRGSRLTCCGGATRPLRGGGTRRWVWRGGMSRKCWRRGRSMGWRSRSSTTASRWRCGGVMTRGCSWPIWRGSTGRWSPRRAVGKRSASWRSGSTKCWRWSRARGRRRCWRFRRVGRLCLRRGRSMPRRRGLCSSARPTWPGRRPWRRARQGRRMSPTPT
jgi:hypothetical protein